MALYQRIMNIVMIFRKKSTALFFYTLAVGIIMSFGLTLQSGRTVAELSRARLPTVSDHSFLDKALDFFAGVTIESNTLFTTAVFWLADK